MKRIRIKTNLKKENIKFMIQVVVVGIILTLIYIATPHCTQATKNLGKWLYELDTEYINRFWMGVLSLTSMISILFCKNKNQK